MAEIVLHDVQKFFGPHQVIKDLNLTIHDGEFVVMLGQSGCGKTTTLRAIAGLESVTDGTIRIDGSQVEGKQASDRDIAFVFQSFSLYPHMTVYENIAFPLRAIRMNKDDREKAVREVADVLRITPLLGKRPSALSGGDMQRVAIGRALVRRPKALLMDEPIGALDAKLREEMRAEIKRLHLSRGSTSVYVTHDQIEAMSLADRIVIMHDGVLQQIGAPDAVYLRPANLFVAQFVGSPVMNVTDVDIASDGVMLGGADGAFAIGAEPLAGVRAGQAVSLGIRPEGVTLAHGATRGHLGAIVTNIEPLGSHDIVDVRVGGTTLRARTESGFASGEGQTVFASIDAAQAHFFDRASGMALRKAS